MFESKGAPLKKEGSSAKLGPPMNIRQNRCHGSDWSREQNVSASQK